MPASGSNSHSGSVKSDPGKKSSKRSKRGGARPQRLKSSYKSQAAVWLESRLLKIATGVTLLGVFLQIIAISTDSWLVMDVAESEYDNMTGTYLVQAHTGLWRWCKTELEQSRLPGGKLETKYGENCETYDLSPTEEEIKKNDNYDRSFLDFDAKDILKIDYTRTAIAFTIIALVIMVIGHCFAFYALKRPRYIIKRLAALLHFMTAACLLVLNEVFIKTVEHEKENMPGRIPDKASTHYGYSFVLSWIVFVFFVLGGLVFLFSSHKRKAEYADEDEAMEDEPMEIFRR